MVKYLWRWIIPFEVSWAFQHETKICQSYSVYMTPLKFLRRLELFLSRWGTSWCLHFFSYLLYLNKLHFREEMTGIYLHQNGQMFNLSVEEGEEECQPFHWNEEQFSQIVMQTMVKVLRSWWDISWSRCEGLEGSVDREPLGVYDRRCCPNVENWIPSAA